MDRRQGASARVSSWGGRRKEKGAAPQSDAFVIQVETDPFDHFSLEKAVSNEREAT